MMTQEARAEFERAEQIEQEKDYYRSHLYAGDIQEAYEFLNESQIAELNEAVKMKDAGKFGAIYMAGIEVMLNYLADNKTAPIEEMPAMLKNQVD